MAIGGLTAVLVTLAVIAGVLAKWATHGSATAAGARQSPSPPSPQPAAPIPPAASSPPSPPAAQPDSPSEPLAEFATDGKGFLNSSARCEDTQSALAIGRTEGSLIVICADPGGHYEYRGVRLTDDAILKASAESTPAHRYLARNAGVTYAVSPAELLVTAGDVLIKREPMIDYREQPTPPPGGARR